MRFRYANRVTAADVGRRVVVRRWVEDPDRGLVPSDVLGELESCSEDGTLAIRTKRGELVTVAASDILAAKPVPPPPRR